MPVTKIVSLEAPGFIRGVIDYPDCRYAKQIEWANEIRFNSEEEAESAWYVPFGVYKPYLK